MGHEHWRSTLLGPVACTTMGPKDTFRALFDSQKNLVGTWSHSGCPKGAGCWKQMARVKVKRTKPEEEWRQKDWRQNGLCGVLLKRAVTEHQFMHDKGRAMQSLKRLIWLSSAMGGVHTATGRDLSEMEPAWDHLSGQGRTNFDSPTSKKTQAFKRLLTFLIRDGQRGDTLQAVFNSLLFRDTSRQMPDLATSNEK
ncbi:PTH4 protein, partial [Polypterus senegalus]